MEAGYARDPTNARGLDAAFFEFAELIALAQLIAGAESEPRAGAHAEFAEGELRVSSQ
jgi:hypothetical protein